MRRMHFVRSGIILLVLSSGLQAQTPASFRVLLGVTDAAPTRWDGTISVSLAGRYTIEGWRFDGGDYVDGTLFYLSTHPPHLIDETAPAAANGFIINTDAVTASSAFCLHDRAGRFQLYSLGGSLRQGHLQAGWTCLCGPGTGGPTVDRNPGRRRLAVHRQWCGWGHLAGLRSVPP